MNDSRIRVMIAHRTPLVRAGLEAGLSAKSDLQLVRAGLGGGMPEEADLASVSVAVADCQLGTQLAGACGPGRCRVLILTNDDREASIRRAIGAGVRGYLLMTSTIDEVVRAVRSVNNGRTVVDPVVAAKMADSLSGRPLTLREVDVLRLVMLGLSDKAIARRLARSVGTVKSHGKALRAKLSATSRTEAIAIARRRGLVPDLELTLAPEHGPEVDLKHTAGVVYQDTDRFGAGAR